MRHGRGVDKALVTVQKPLESQNTTDTFNPRVHVTKARDITNLQQSRFVNIQQ